jgi:hypothetical protein
MVCSSWKPGGHLNIWMSGSTLSFSYELCFIPIMSLLQLLDVTDEDQL